MVLVYMVNGECVEVEDAFSAENDDQQLVCYDRERDVVRVFNVADVSMFTADPQTVDLIKDELCEEDVAPAR
jgi:hypothetical protein